MHMNLYRLWWIDPHEGTCYQWFAFKQDAIVAREQKMMEHKDAPLDAPDYQISAVDVPTNRKQKVALAKWLNARFTRDNG
jgi:hypothetical protein